jgi:hypothetical protein
MPPSAAAPRYRLAYLARAYDYYHVLHQTLLTTTMLAQGNDLRSVN